MHSRGEYIQAIANAHTGNNCVVLYIQRLIYDSHPSVLVSEVIKYIASKSKRTGSK